MKSQMGHLQSLPPGVHRNLASHCFKMTYKQSELTIAVLAASWSVYESGLVSLHEANRQRSYIVRSANQCRLCPLDLVLSAFLGPAFSEVDTESVQLEHWGNCERWHHVNVLGL